MNDSLTPFLLYNEGFSPVLSENAILQELFYKKLESPVGGEWQFAGGIIYMYSRAQRRVGMIIHEYFPEFWFSHIHTLFYFTFLLADFWFPGYGDGSLWKYPYSDENKTRKHWYLLFAIHAVSVHPLST